MTRQEVAKIFPEATEEQITAFLNQNNAEVATERGKADKWKSDASKYQTAEEEKAALQQRIEELENEKLSDDEKRKKEFADKYASLEKKVAESEKRNNELLAQLTSEQIKSYAGSKGLSGEHIENILKSFGANYEFAVSAIDSMVKLISEKEEAAALVREQEIAKQSSNPGGNPGTGEDGKPADVAFAESISFGNPVSDSSSDRDYYVLGK